MQAVTFGNGRTQERSYDLDGRMASFSLSAQTMTLTYDAASRIKAIGDVANPAAGNTYDYDLLDRLTNVERHGVSATKPTQPDQLLIELMVALASMSAVPLNGRTALYQAQPGQTARGRRARLRHPAALVMDVLLNSMDDQTTQT